VAKVMLAVAVGLELIGGLGLVLGLDFAPYALMAFLLAVTPIMHNPQGLTGDAHQQELIAILKNVALFGGLLFMTAKATAAVKSAKKSN